jgi:hypothetical protein
MGWSARWRAVTPRYGPHVCCSAGDWMCAIVQGTACVLWYRGLHGCWGWVVQGRGWGSLDWWRIDMDGGRDHFDCSWNACTVYVCGRWSW